VCAPPVRHPAINSPSVTAPLFFSTSTLPFYSPKCRTIDAMVAVPLLPKSPVWLVMGAGLCLFFQKLHFDPKWRLRLLFSKPHPAAFYECFCALQNVVSRGDDRPSSYRNSMSARKESRTTEHENERRVV